MDRGVHLALAAIVRGLHRSGAIGNEAVATIVAEMMIASEEASAILHDFDALHLHRLAEEIAIDASLSPGFGGGPSFAIDPDREDR